jgi:hypothetical protein
MEKEIEFLKHFVEGNIDIKIFEKELYENENLKEKLEDHNLNWGETYIKNSNPYLYLLELDYSDSGDRLKAQGTVELFLQAKGIAFDESKQFNNEYSLMLDTQPKYLDVSMKFIEEFILPKDKNKTKNEVKEHMKLKFKEYFKYHNKPPRWIQSPKWIIKNNIPLFFLGQMEIKDCKLFHDNGFIYIFIDEKTGEVETIIQLY